MTEEKKYKNIDYKLQSIKQEVMIMQKNKDGYGYKYVDEESILLKVNQRMIELGLKLTPRFVPGTVHSEQVNYKDKKGNECTDILVRSEMVFVWKDIETGEEEFVPWAMLGQQSDGSQALGSGLTYSNRYFLLKYFNIATSKDDPDKIRSEMKKEEERKKMSAIQTKTKKIFAKAVTTIGDKQKVYEKLGISREDFMKKYEKDDTCTELYEQMELILKG